MNHEHVEQNAVVDLYLMGRLGPDEAAAFEEHYLSCAACLEQLETAESFQSGIKRVAAEDAVKAAVAQRVGVLAWLARGARSPRAGLAAAAILAAVLLPSTLLYRQVQREQTRVDALAGALEPNHLDALAVSLPSSFLRPGDYELVVEGLPPDGTPVAAGRFAFRVGG